MSVKAVQRDAVRGSWSRARSNWDVQGAALFQDLFNKAPGSFEKFNSLFAGRAKSDIAGSSELAAQAQSFKGALDMFIDNMDNGNVLNIQIGRFCKLHKARGVGAADMERAFELLVGRMVQYFDADASSWQAVCDYLMSLMRGHL